MFSCKMIRGSARKLARITGAKTRGKPDAEARTPSGHTAENIRAMLNDIRVRGEQLTSDINNLRQRLA